MSFLITKSESYCKISEKNLNKKIIKFQVRSPPGPAWFEFPLLSKRLLLRSPLNSRGLAFTRALNETREERVKKKIHIHRDPSCNNLLLLFTTTHCNNSLLVSCRESEVLQTFLTECGKQFGIPLVLLYFAL